MARRTRRYVVFLYGLPVLCALAFVVAGGARLALLLLAAPVVGVLAAQVVGVTPAPKWVAPRRTRKRSTLRRWQFPLRSIMTLVTAAAVLFGLLTWGPTGALAVAGLFAVLIGLAVDRLLEAVSFKAASSPQSTAELVPREDL